MEAAKRVAKNTGILYIKMAVTLFISLYATRLTLQALGTDDFGIFNLIGGMIAMLGFLNNAIASATQRFISYSQGAGNHNKVRAIFNMSLLLHLATGMLVIGILEVAGYFFFNGLLNIASNRLETAELIYQSMVFSTFLTIFSAPYEAVITSHENMFFYALLGIFEAVLKLIIAFYIGNSEFDHLLTYGYLLAGLAVVLCLVKLIYCHCKYSECKISIKTYFDKSLLKQLTGFAGWTFLGAATSMLSNYGQGLVINVFFGVTYNAAQGIANQVSGQLGAFASTMLRALNPLLDKSAGAGNHQLMKQASLMGSKVSFFLLMILYIPALVEMPYIFKLWLINPPEYAVVFCSLLLLRDLLGQMFVTLTSSIAAMGEIKKFQIYSALLTLLPLSVTTLLFYYGYPAISLYWVYLGFVCIFSAQILYFAKLKCAISINEFLRTVVSRCVIAFCLGIALTALPSYYLGSGWLRLILVCAINLLCSTLIIWYIGFTGAERRKISAMIKSLINAVVTRIKPSSSLRIS